MRLLALVAVLGCGSAPAQPDATAPDASQEVGVTAFAGTNPDLPAGDLAPLDALIGDARYIGLGESIHTSGGYYAFKRRMIEHLVLDRDVRVIAIESPRTGARTLDAYLASDCTGDATAAIRTGMFPVFADDNTLALVQWLCSFNVVHPHDRVKLFGFDMQQPTDDLAELTAAGATVDPACHTAPGAYADADYRACTASLDAIAAHLGGTRAAIAAVSFRAWQDMTYFLQRDLAKAFTARDVAMSEIFTALRDLDYPSDRMVVWAHDYHLMRDHLHVTGDSVAGATTMGMLLGDDYAAIALVGDQVDINWPGEAADTEPVAGSLVAHLHALGEPALIVDTHAPIAAGAQVLRDGASFGDGTMTVADQFRALVYLDHSPAMHALFW